MKRILAFVLALGLVAPALADTQALSFTGGNSYSSVDAPLPNTVGWIFSLDSDIMLTQLGFYDLGGNGLLASHEVAIWRDDGTQVASATVAASSALSDGFRWTGVTSVLMTAGEYRIGALVDQDDYYYSGVSAIATASPVEYIAGAYATGGFAFPDQAGITVNGRFGPNFQFVTAVPEPATWLLMLGGLVAVAGVARRRRNMP